MSRRPEVMPTEADQEHIYPLAQVLIDAAQEYARDHGMTLQGVLSAVGTMAGALLARAYSDKETAQMVAERLPVAALAMVEAMHRRDEMILARNVEAPPKGSA